MFFLGWDGREQRLCWQCFPHQFGECHDTETLLPTRDWREERNSLISRHLHSLDCGGCNISLLHWTKRFIISSIPSIKYWDSQTDRVNLMLVHYWISRTPPSPASPLSVKTNLVLGISTDLFKNTIYISFGQGWDYGGDLKLIFVRDRQKIRDTSELSIKTLARSPVSYSQVLPKTE